MSKAVRLTIVLASLALPFRGSSQDAAPTAAAAVQPFVDRHALDGAIMLVADKDKVLDVETAGFADIAAG